MNITIKGLSPKVHRKLKAQARVNKRSLNGEVLAILEDNLDDWPERVRLALAEARQLRKRFKGPALTEEFLEMAKGQGRP